MKKTIFALSFLLLLASGSVFAEKYSFSVQKSDVSEGIVIRKIWLKNYEKPQVVISDVAYTTVDALPVEALPQSAAHFDIMLGKEQKRPFALVRIPAYAPDGTGAKLITSFTLDVTENTYQESNSANKTTAVNSPLATGNWYKVATVSAGFYKVDFDFVSSKLGISSPFSSANIRVFGKGGHMLPENNAIANEDMGELAISVYDGGDGTFGPGDYFIFYGQGLIDWLPDTSAKVFTHTKNLYEDKGYYFLNFDAPGKRVSLQGGVGAPNVTVTSYNDHQLHEEDLANPAKFGKRWWGEDFGISPGKVASRTFEMDLGNLVADAKFVIPIASRSVADGNLFTVSRNGAMIGSYTMGPAGQNEDSPPITLRTLKFDGANASGKNIFTLQYQPSTSEGLGYVDYIEANTRRVLAFDGGAFSFRDMNSVGAGNIASYVVGNSDATTDVWDITDPYNAVRMNGSLSGSSYTFVQDASRLREFAAMKSGQTMNVEYVSKLDNQNLHGLGPIDYVIITHSDFISAANNLADFHRNRSGMRVLVTTPQQIYNEFSTGAQDISAIRNFLRMLYDNAGTDITLMPKYVLMLGDASYDYKARIANNNNLVPTFESEESLDIYGNYCGDDFFAFLDDNEYIERTDIANTLDLGIGRLPVKNLDEANTVVNKVIRYKSPESLGPWRLNTTLIADNEDNAGPHMEDGEIMDSTILKETPLYNASKIYLDAIPNISTPGGQRSPDATKMINDQMFKGTFLLNYNGHGNTEVLAHERIVTADEYNKWSNLNKLPIMVTATCDFGQYDQPQYVSAGEEIVLKKDGGSISSITTVKAVFQYSNRILNRDYLDAMFQRNNGRWNTFGDALRIGKNKTYTLGASVVDQIPNFRKFSLFGDPALEPDFPEYYIYTENVKDGVTGAETDTMSALGSYVINGYVGDKSGNALSNFNGRLYVVIYDKPRTVKTLTAINKTFSVRNNIIYKGKATVTNGKFSVAFIAPKDINYEMGKGKLSLYAENGITDAAGADFSYSIGGYSDHPVLENNPPVVRPYIGDSLFQNGGLTGPNPLLFVILEDETGINVSGNAVGHDLTAILDNKIEVPFVLNDYYETETNTYKRGYVNFPLYNLSEGRHRITVKAWDVNNNSGTGSIDFEVANGSIMKVQKLLNYPNPFRDKTHFIFEHNHPEETLYAEINIYTTAGQLVRTIKQSYEAGAGRSREIEWDGTSNDGAMLQSGLYIYKIMVMSENGAKDMAYQKLVISR